MKKQDLEELKVIILSVLACSGLFIGRLLDYYNLFNESTPLNITLIYAIPFAIIFITCWIFLLKIIYKCDHR